MYNLCKNYVNYYDTDMFHTTLSRQQYANKFHLVQIITIATFLVNESTRLLLQERHVQIFGFVLPEEMIYISTILY